MSFCSLEDVAEDMAAVCFLATTCCSGLVIALVAAPASMPSAMVDVRRANKPVALDIPVAFLGTPALLIDPGIDGDKAYGRRSR